MRFRSITTILIVFFLLFTSYVVSRVANLVSLFFSHSGIALTQAQVLEAYTEDRNGSFFSKRKQEIPKTIHQIFHNWKQPGNETLPDDWEQTRKSCKETNGGWEYHLWTEKNSLEFIKEGYPWFVETYEGYKYPVQRTDALRYFLILHFGGIYLDLDNGCLQNLEPLLYYPFWTTDGGRGALSNNILGGRPNHPFWQMMVESLKPYNWNYIFPYVTISLASGQWFETDVWESYHRSLPENSESYDKNEKKAKIGARESLARKEKDGKDIKETEKAKLEERIARGEGVRLMMDDRPGTDEWLFFTQERGGSWVNWDNAMWLWIGDHLFLEGFVLVLMTGVTGWSIRRWWQRGGFGGTRGRYEKVGEKRDERDNDV